MRGAALTVERVRLRGDADPATARNRLGNLLSVAGLRPPGLPPAAVLCVRHVRDPLPGALRLDAADARPPPEWERAFVAALERARREAARPALEAVPAGAGAVLFADRAELLACLARDSLDGIAWTRWWWRRLVQPAAAGGDGPLVTAWLDAPRHVPAALELLAARHEAAPFAASLPAAAATELAGRVAAAFAAPELRAAIVAHPPEPRAASPAAATRPEAGAPWRDVVPEAARGLDAPQELLLGVALALRRAPATARTRAFAVAVERWRAAPRAVGARPPAAAAARLPGAPELDAPAASGAPRTAPAVRARAAPPERAAEPRARTGPGPAPERAAESQAGTGAGLAATASPAPAESRARPRARDRQVAQQHSAPSSGPEPTRAAPPPGAAASAEPSRAAVALRPPGPARAPERAAATRAAGRRPPDRAPAPGLTAPLHLDELPTERPALVVDTELGGAFYLVDLVLFLGLYGDFTTPLEPGIELDLWDCVALLAGRLLGRPPPDDPLWGLLAQLAGRRPSDPPGRGFRPPPAWRPPRAWLEPFEQDGVWRWSAARGALRVVHPAGFAALAVPRTAVTPRKQLERDLRRIGASGVARRRSSLPPEPARPLARWAARLGTYADARLRLALDLAPEDSLPQILLRRRARVFVSPTHVDVVLRLADLPLAVRFAGLDRTPGWIPAAGRFVALHFE